ncbi:MAG: hypothetical protein ABJZ55_20480 [Fuerstiella sp.]
MLCYVEVASGDLMTIDVPQSLEVFALCYAKTSWADDWVEVPLLECLKVGNQAAPAHATASFRYEYGIAILPEIGSRDADVAPAVIPKPEIHPAYVRVVTDAWTWYGVLMEAADDRFGDIMVGGTAYPSGVITYTAFGLSILLDFTPIRQSLFDRGAVATLPKALVVNSGYLEDEWQANQSQESVAEDDEGLDLDPVGRSVFYQRPGGGELQSLEPDPIPWRAAEFLEYLLANFAGTNRLGEQSLSVTVTGAVTALDYVMERFEYEGQTIWEIMNRLISRDRGVGFAVSFDDSNDGIAVNIFSFSPVAVPLPSAAGVTIPANQNQVSLNLSAALNVTKEQVTESVFNVYDQVRILGECRGSVFTVDDGDMAPRWTTEEQDKYNTAATDQDGFSGLDDDDKYRRNQEVRSGDDLADVYSAWEFSSVFSGFQLFAIWPVILSDGTLDYQSTSTFMRAGLKIQDYIPMQAGKDYSGEVDAEGVGEVTAEFNRKESQWLPPQVWFDTILAEHLDADADSESIEDGRQWSVSTQLHAEYPGLIFEVTGGKQHFIAADLYTANDDYEELADEDRVLDHDQWEATIYVQTQERVSAEWPPSVTDPDEDFVEPDVWRVLEVMAPGMHFDLLAEGTVVGYELDGGVRTPIQAAGGILRDDRDVLLDQARLIWEYVRQPRRLLTVNFEAVNSVIPVGVMITTIGGGTANEQQVNSVVTSVELDLKTGGTAIKTEGGELDIVEGQV